MEVRIIIICLVIRNQIGNFGEVPYGKTIVGYVYYQKNKEQQRYYKSNIVI